MVGYRAHDMERLMHFPAVVFLAALLVACGSRTDPAEHRDSAPGAGAVVDTVAAAALRDSARTTLATLLDDPSSAVFGSVVVVQPPREGDRATALAVCGTVSGRPGIGGRTGPARFIYQNKWALFVEEDANRAEFANLWATRCEADGGVVVIGG